MTDPSARPPAARRRVALMVGLGLALAVAGVVYVVSAPAPPAPSPAPQAAPESAALKSVATLPTLAQSAPAPRRASPITVPNHLGNLRRGIMLPRKPSGEPLAESISGKAKLAGRLYRLDAASDALGDATQVCLDAPEAAAALGGVQPTCRPLKGWPGSTAMCDRDDRAQAVPLTGPLTWRLPCP